MSRFTAYKNATRFRERIQRIQRMLWISDDGVIGNQTLSSIEDLLTKKRKEDPDSLFIQEEGVVQISTDALSLIVDFETGGKSYYSRYLKRPSWPGYSSGVTIGFGYDLGYNTKEMIQRDWGSHLSSGDLDALKGVSGIRGASAESLAENLSSMDIPWEIAERVFHEITLPKYAALAATKFEGAEKLHPHAFGAIVSLVFNRGTSITGSRRSEMKEIRDLVAGSHSDETYRAISDQILSMRRLWKKVNGKSDLWGRRTAEADLVMRSLSDSSPQVIRL